MMLKNTVIATADSNKQRSEKSWRTAKTKNYWRWPKHNKIWRTMWPEARW